MERLIRDGHLKIRKQGKKIVLLIIYYLIDIPVDIEYIDKDDTEVDF